MKTLEKVILVILFLAICSISFAQETPLETNEGVKIEKPTKGKKAIEKVDKAQKELVKGEKEFLSKLSKEERKALQEKFKNMTPDERKQYLQDRKVQAGEHVDGVQRGKPSKDTGEIDGVQRGKAEKNTSATEHTTKGKAKAKKVNPGLAKGHEKQRLRAQSERLGEAQKIQKNTEQKVAQIQTKLDQKLTEGKITKEVYAQKMSKLNALKERLATVAVRREKQASQIETKVSAE